MNDFLRGISRGIFGEMERGRVTQEKKDTERKGQIIDLLSNLAPQVEPESLPLLLGHLGDTIGIKGKTRKFWNIFSGQPDMTPEAQMGDLMRNLSSQLTGPDTARAKRQQFGLPVALRALSGDRSATPEEATRAAGLSDKIVLRDPRREKLGELETRYGLQNEMNLFKLGMTQDFQRRQQEDRQRHAEEMVGIRADAKAQEDINERAWMMAVNKGFRSPNAAIKSQAAAELAREQGWSNEKLQSQIRFLNARTQEAQANAQSIATTGMKVGEAGRLDLSKKNFYDDQAKEYSSSLAQMRDAEAKLKEFREGVSKQTDAIKARVQAGQLNQADAEFTISYLEGKDRARIAEEEGKKAGAYTKAISAYNKLKDKDNTYYGVGDFGTDITSTTQKATPPAKAQRPSLPEAGIGTTKGIVKIPTVTPSTYEVGGRLKYGGKWYKIVGIKSNFIEGIPE